jgi:hypothetical protein
MNGQNYNLNLYIQKDEIIKCIQKLKNNKAGGEDEPQYIFSFSFLKVQRMNAM